MNTPKLHATIRREHEAKWLQEYRDNKNRKRLELVAIMRWWKAQHPEFSDVRVIQHGWYGHCISAVFRNERTIVAKVQDVKEEYAKK